MVTYVIDRAGAVEAVCRLERHVGAAPGRVWGQASKTPVAVRIGRTVLLMPGIDARDRRAAAALLRPQSR